jgi:hypothetical protein
MVMRMVSLPVVADLPSLRHKTEEYPMHEDKSMAMCASKPTDRDML